MLKVYLYFEKNLNKTSMDYYLFQIEIFSDNFDLLKSIFDNFCYTECDEINNNKITVKRYNSILSFYSNSLSLEFKEKIIEGISNKLKVFVSNYYATNVKVCSFEV